MRRWVIDTNVPVVANGRDDGGRSYAVECHEAAIRFLVRVLSERERVILDAAGEVEAEYRTYLHPRGQPGVGDRFYQEIVRNWTLHERIDLPTRPDGEYEDLPQELIDAGFDPDDRKFAALAKRERVPVANATDSDWLGALAMLKRHGIRVAFVCGRDERRWFAAPGAAEGA